MSDKALIATILRMYRRCDMDKAMRLPIFLKTERMIEKGTVATKIVILIFSLLMAIFFSVGVLAEDAKTFDIEVLSFLSGNYRLIGQCPNSGTTYSGRVLLQLQEHGHTFKVIRTIEGKAVYGTAFIDTATPDRIPVLRMRFFMNGKDYEATYLWRSDLDNYARLTGYVYLSDFNTESPGLEALFSIPPTLTND